MEASELIQKAKTFLFQDDVFASIVGWADDRCAAIDLTNDEHKLEYSKLHEEFEAFFESKLEKYLVDCGSSTEELFSVLATAGEGSGNAALLGEGDAQETIKFILAAADYDVFMQLMRDVARSKAAAS